MKMVQNIIIFRKKRVIISSYAKKSGPAFLTMSKREFKFNWIRIKSILNIIAMHTKTQPIDGTKKKVPFEIVDMIKKYRVSITRAYYKQTKKKL